MNELRYEPLVIDPLTLDSTEEISIQLSWLAEAPCYDGRFHMYIFQSFTTPPKQMSALIIIGGSIGNSRNMLLLLHTESWSGERVSQFERRRLEWHKEFVANDLEWDIAKSICVLYLVLIEDTEKFITEMNERILDLVKITESTTSPISILTITCGHRPFQEESGLQTTNSSICSPWKIAAASPC